MSSKLPGMPVLVLALVGFAAFLGTLLGAASMVCACLARKRDGRALVLAALVCGLVVMVLTVGTFAAINTANINLAAVGAWFTSGYSGEPGHSLQGERPGQERLLVRSEQGARCCSARVGRAVPPDTREQAGHPSRNRYLRVTVLNAVKRFDGVRGLF